MKRDRKNYVETVKEVNTEVLASSAQ